MGDTPYRRRHENPAGVDVLPNNPPCLFARKNVILGAASHGLHHHLWAIGCRSAQEWALTGPWAMPPITGAMKIERGWMYYLTIHHGDYLGKKVILASQGAMREDPYCWCQANQSEVYGVSYLF
jgi:hypothetical protein